MRRSTKLLNLCLSFLCLTGVSCSNDDEPYVPSDAVTVNMLFDNNATTIGGSDVYINSAQNFTSEYCAIANLGKNGDLNRNPDLSQIAQEVAVTPGNFYQVLLAQDIRTVAGTLAIPINTNYYNAYVNSWIYDMNKERVGAKVSYTESFPETDRLPDWNSMITLKLNEDNSLYTAEYSFSEGCVIDQNVEADWYNGENSIKDQISFNISKNRLQLSFPKYASSGKPDIRLYVRFENIYSRVYLKFE